ncbi:hypothetical protein P3875_02100 [Myroides sp. JBRI-B21084]|uniref:hypothetical protein n=1 Tax=Myroides sp. JBRI-B21084 TaxID=3119977 RepID=UPI0026E25677|nr:hypothetical protein [Paenimyroides cloacae]WKW46874.1 hypothetical protein P3875_02100 [Paenimyroides cloacae]
MTTKRKIKIILTLTICIFFLKCNSKDNSTQIFEIDKKYKFENKNAYEFSKDSMFTRVELFYNRSLEDSVYTVGIKQEEGYLIRARGWGFKERRIGDWYYEKVYDNQRVVIDSIINYVSFCNKNPRNTIKKFKSNKLNRSKGYFYEIDMNKNVTVGDTLNIRLDFLYDTLIYKNVGRELYIFIPSDFHNLCDATQNVVDSFPVIGNTANMRLLISEKDRGKNRYLGYYYLIPKKQKNSFTATQIFTEINFEVK